MAYNYLERLGLASIVNDSEVEVNEPEPQQGKVPYNYTARVLGATAELGDIPIVPDEEVERRKIEARKPKTWFGELTAGVARGVDSLQETGYAAGALASDWVGWDSAKNYFIGKTQQQEEEMKMNPAGVASYDDVDGFDKGMRYFLGQLGQGVPQVAESALTGVIGAAAGSAVEPGGGTIVGGLSGVVGRQAVKDILKSGVNTLVKDEIKDFAAGKIKREALSEVTESIFRNQVANLTKKYGAQAAIAVNSIAQESGSIYSDLLNNPNVSESDRKVAATVGGLIAAIPDTVVGGWIAGKFFPGVKEVGREQLKAAENYLTQYAKVYGKELLKVIPAEGGQEFIQTVVEQASKDWAEFGPAEAMRRVTSPTPDQVKERVDATLGGGIMGILGGGVSAVAEMRAHPNPEVRTRQRDVEQRADDLSEGVEIDSDDRELSKIAETRVALQNELASATDDQSRQRIQAEVSKLDEQELEIKTRLGIVNDSAVEETPGATETTETTPVRTPTPADRAIEGLRALYARKMPIGKQTIQAKQEDLDAKSAEIEAIVNDTGTEPEAEAYKTKLREVLNEKGMLNMLASEGVHIATPDKAKSASGKKVTGFAVSIAEDGTIELVIPKYEALSPDSDTENTAAYINNLPKLLEHEAIHIADAIGQRDEFNASKELQRKHKIFHDYAVAVDKERAQALIKWWDGLTEKEKARFPSIGRQVRQAYEPGKAGRAADYELSGEVPRMMVELARRGELHETTDAIIQLESKRRGGQVSKFLKTWIDALKRIHKTLAKLLDFKTAPAEIVKAFHQIQEVLDKYGAISENAIVDDSKTTNEETTEQKGTEQEESAEEEGEVEQGVSEEVDGPMPDWLSNNDKSLVEQLKEKSPALLERVTDLHADGLTAGQIAKAIGGDVDADMVRSIRRGLGLPDQGRSAGGMMGEVKPADKAQQKKFDEWAAKYKAEKNQEDTPESIAKELGLTYEGVAGEDIGFPVHSFSDRTTIPGKVISIGFEGIPTLEGVADQMAEKVKAFQPAEPVSSTIVEAPKEEEKPKRKRGRKMKRRPGFNKDGSKVKPKQAKQRTIPNELFTDDEKRMAAAELGIKFDGDMLGMMDVFTDYNEGPAYGASLALRLPYTKDDLERKLAETRARFYAPAKESKRLNAQFEGTTPETVKTFWLAPDGRVVGSDKLHQHTIIASSLFPESNDSFDELFKRGWVRGARIPDDNAFWVGSTKTITPKQKRSLEDIAVAQNAVIEDESRGEIIFDYRGNAKEAKRFNTKREAEVEKMAMDVADQTRKALLGFESNRPIIQPRQGQTDTDNYSPAVLEYATARHTESAARAQMLIDERGLWNVIEELQSNRYGDGLGIEEDTDDADNPTNSGPNAILKAVYELALVHLDHIRGEMEGNYKFANKDRAIVDDTFRQLEAQMRKIGTQTGQFNAFTGKMMQFWNAAKAKAAYLEPILAHVTKIFGSKGVDYVKELAKELNGAMSQYIGGVMTRPEMIAFFRKFQKVVHTRDWQNAVRKTIANDAKKVKRATKKGSQRAAEHQAMDEDGEAYVNKVVESILKDMTGIPKDASTRTELELFKTVIARMAREVGEDMGIIAGKPKIEKATMEQQFAAILKNDALYAQFVNGLHDAYVKEYGGENPSEEFLDEADMLRARLANRWTPGMVDGLVKEKMQQHNQKFSEIVRDQYGRGIYERHKLVNAITEYMLGEGVDNPDLINAIVDDIEASFDEQLETAREKFFGNTKGVKDALKHFQETIAEVAKEHVAYSEQYQGQFSKYLIDELGFPEEYANQLGKIMQAQLNRMLNGYTDGKGKYHPGEREKIINRWIEQSKAGEKEKKKMLTAAERVVQLANMGVMRAEDVYRALQEKFDLPPYKPEVAAEIERIGDEIAQATDDRTREIWLQTLSHYLEGQKGINTKDLYIAGLYVSMLSGPSTQVVNIAANAASVLGYTAVEAVKHPFRIGKMIRAIVRAATGAGQVEAREAFFTGMTLGKTGEKYFHGSRPLEQADPVFTSKFNNPTARKLDEGLAKFLHKLIRGLRGHYIGRALSAMDIFFYKIAQDVAYTARTGEMAVGTPEQWHSAKLAARREVEKQGMDPDTNRAHKRRMMVLAHGYYRDAIVNDTQTTNEWKEAHSEAMDATFQQEPKGWLGLLARLADKWTADKPLGKLIIPFTRVAANVTNHMLEWTPYGYARWMFSKDFMKKDEKGNVIEPEGDNIFSKFLSVRNNDIAIRATMGMALIFALMAKLADEDDEDDPDFTIYADGPRDLNEKRQMMERGWKPYTIKVGDTYYSYLYTPVGMAFSIVGRLMDDYREGKTEKPSVYNVNMASAATAMLRLVTEQSFLAGASDIMSAVDSPDPVGKLSKFFARASTTFFVPNVAKQLDRWVDPTVQEANTFWEAFLREIPYARSTQLKPMLNVFGDEVKRTQGPLSFPGSERFLTVEPGNDPVFNFLGEKRIIVPGYSKTSQLHGVKMTQEQFYEYVQAAGPRVKKAINAELMRLQKMDRETAQERVQTIATDVKKSVRRELERKYPK